MTPRTESWTLTAISILRLRERFVFDVGIGVSIGVGDGADVGVLVEQQPLLCKWFILLKADRSSSRNSLEGPTNATPTQQLWFMVSPLQQLRAQPSCWPGHLVQGKQLFNSRRICGFRCHQQNIHGQSVWDREWKRERGVRRAVSGSVLAAATIWSSFKCGNDYDNGDSQTTFLWYVTRIFNICTRISILVAFTLPLSRSLSCS